MAAADPILGWRVWMMRDEQLGSIAQPVYWRPGENRAECLAPQRCSEVPGASCRCGFWALFNPVAAMQLLQPDIQLATRRGSSRYSSLAVGLIQGFGHVSLHGSEGFRAELAVITCLFTLPEPMGVLRQIISGLRRSKRSQLFQNSIQRAADKYGVPCVSLESAVSTGVLQEFGIANEAVDELRAWIAAGGLRPRVQPPSLPPTPPPSRPPPSGPLRLRPA